MQQIDLFNQVNNYEEESLRDYLYPEIRTWALNLPINVLAGLKNTLLVVDILRKQDTIFPLKGKELRIFNALDWNSIKVVILGQDCYHTQGLANGFAFGCETGISPSLRQIISAMKKDLGVKSFSEDTKPNLEYLVKQGVFLLNTILTVEEGKPLSHSEVGWQTFTNAIITYISQNTDAIFLLWGNVAQSKKGLIKDNIVLENSHPASAGYKGVQWVCNHFSEVNKILKERNQKEITWL